jgi:hypothetical protein
MDTENCSSSEGSLAVAAHPYGRHTFEGGKVLGSGKGKSLGCEPFYEQRREFEQGLYCV